MRNVGLGMVELCCSRWSYINILDSNLKPDTKAGTTLTYIVAPRQQPLASKMTIETPVIVSNQSVESASLANQTTNTRSRSCLTARETALGTAMFMVKPSVKQGAMGPSVCAENAPIAGKLSFKSISDARIRC